jgi:hypothetical protein
MLAYFMAIWFILRPFGIFCGLLIVNWYIFPFLVFCSKKNLATLFPADFFCTTVSRLSQSYENILIIVITYVKVPGLPDFSWYNIPKREKQTISPQNIPNRLEIYQKCVLNSG